VSSHREVEPLEPTAVMRPRRPTVHAERIALVDLLDRVLAGGVVISGEVTLSIADVDMVRVSLRALVTSVSTLARAGADQEGPGR
jgi:gas vesicle protein GvpA/GvpJ/GvpM family